MSSTLFVVKILDSFWIGFFSIRIGMVILVEYLGIVGICTEFMGIEGNYAIGAHEFL